MVLIFFATKNWYRATYHLSVKAIFLQMGDILNLNISNGCYCNNLTVSASLQVSLIFAWLCVCQHQATCAQPEALDHRKAFSYKKMVNSDPYIQ